MLADTVPTQSKGASLFEDLTPAERIVLAVDCQPRQVTSLLGIAKECGASFVKIGLELSTNLGWHNCSIVVENSGLEWIADAKLHDIPNTMAGAAREFLLLPHPPVAITVHAAAGTVALEATADAAGPIMLLGVTLLTSLDGRDVERMFNRGRGGVVADLAGEVPSNHGVVCAVSDLPFVKAVNRGLLAMVPGTRSKGVEANDQRNVATPAEAIAFGADLLVIGRQITQADDPLAAFSAVVDEITGAWA